MDVHVYEINVVIHDNYFRMVGMPFTWQMKPFMEDSNWYT